MPFGIEPLGAHFFVDNSRLHYKELWDKYNPELLKYYNTEQYVIDSRTLNKEKIGNSHGAKKTMEMFHFPNGANYAEIKARNNSFIIKELAQYFPILLKFLQLREEKGYIFNIPKIYKNIESTGPNVGALAYIMDGVVFDSNIKNPLAKNIKYKSLLNECIAQGQFFDFILYEAKYIPYDCESYVDDNTEVLNFIDFGDYDKIIDERNEKDVDMFKSDLSDSIRLAISQEFSDISKPETLKMISEGATCILSQIRN